jgi:predicted enzyme related to lactoylglutathione lyase
MAEVQDTINYIEFAATDVAKAKLFYETVFGWSFLDYGPDYSSFDRNTAGINGGFYKADAHDAQPKTAPLIVIYSSDLQATQDAVIAAGGTVVVPTFDFPGGRRFHFDDSVGNVLAVWSE